MSCGGVQCGKGAGCKLIKVDVCGVDAVHNQQQEDASYRTCMKYDKGTPKFFKITNKTLGFDCNHLIPFNISINYLFRSVSE